MSVSFGGSDYLTCSSAVTSSYPLSMVAWVYPNNATAGHDIMGIRTAGTTNNQWCLQLRGDVAGDPVAAVSVGTLPSNASALSSGSFTASAWNHAAAVFSGATGRLAYVNGGGSGSNTTSVTTSGVNRTTVGGFSNSPGTGENFDGMIAEAAIYNLALSATDIAFLATGISPLLYKPNNLLAYWPLVVAGQTVDVVGGFDLATATGSPASAEHCRILNRRGRHHPLVVPKPNFGPLQPSLVQGRILC